MKPPIVVDLYCGLGGWSEGFLAEGWECHGYDIEAHDYGSGGYPGTLHIRDVLSIHGSEFKDAACIVGSSPCQEFSYRAMPWKRAKALPPPYLGMELFNAQFRIQREACEAAGRYIPMVVENVRGAQKWIGRAAYHYGSFYLWGDVPALMPTSKPKAKVPGLNWKLGSATYCGKAFNSTAVANLACSCPMECDCQNPDGEVALVSSECPIHNLNPRPALTCPIHGEPQTGVKVPSSIGRRTDVGKGARFTTRDCGIEAIYADRDSEGTKQHGSGHIWYRTGNGALPSSSPRCKAASAMIAKIPYPLSLHIARTFKPQENS